MSIFLFHLSPHVNTTTTWLNFSTCYSVFCLRATCTGLGFWRGILLLILCPFKCWFSFPLGHRQQKTTKVHVEDPVRRCKMYQIICKKRTVDPAASSSDTLESMVTVYLIHINCEGEWRQHTPLLESSISCEQKAHWVPSGFGSIISQLLFSRHFTHSFPGTLMGDALVVSAFKDDHHSLPIF